MTFRTRLASLIVLALAGFLSAPHAASAQGFELTFCNKSNVDAGVAFAVRLNPETWVVAGWLIVNPGQCRSPGSFVGPRFYWYAQENGGDQEWAGSDVRLCVEHPGPFTYQYREGMRCNEGQAKGFAEVVLDEGDTEYTLDLE